MKLTKTQLREIIKEEISKLTINERIIKEDAATVGVIALGVAGGIVGLLGLVGGLNLVGKAAAELSFVFKEKARKARQKAERQGRFDTVKSIVDKFENDQTLKQMYENLPPYSDVKKRNERTKQLKDISNYIKSKLTDEEMQYFRDISSMLRTGDVDSR
jgi:hypothetical protein